MITSPVRRPSAHRSWWSAVLSVLLMCGSVACEDARAESAKATPCAEAFPDIFDRVSPAVVSISATPINPYRLSERVSHIVGSGVLIDASGLILTISPRRRILSEEERRAPGLLLDTWCARI